MRLLLDYPTLLFFVCFGPAWILLFNYKPEDKTLARVGAICGLASLAMVGCMLFLNLERASLIWHDEANILSIAAAFIHGEPIYHASSSPNFYSLLYGPSTFLVYVPIIWRSSHPLANTRIVSVILTLLNLMLFYRLMRTWLPPLTAFALLPIATSVMVMLPSILLGVRGDSWLVCCLSLALLAVLRPHWIQAALISGILCGLALDFKISTVPVFCLLLAILHRHHSRNGTRAVVVSAMAAIVTALSIFVIPNISLPHYITWLQRGSNQHLLASQLFGNVIVALFVVAAPICLWCLGSTARSSHRRGHAIPLLFVLALTACIITGAKDGAGAWHLWPMLPFLMLWTAHEVFIRTSKPSSCSPTNPLLTPIVVTAVSMAATIITMRYGLRAVEALHVRANASQRAQERASEAELKLVEQRFPTKNLSMGYGSLLADDRSYLRFELPLEQQNFFFDANALVEATKEHIGVPDNVVDRITSCEDLWLIPHGETPFSTSRIGAFAVAGYLFPNSIRLGFPATHVLVHTGKTYDVWACKLESTLRISDVPR